MISALPQEQDPEWLGNITDENISNQMEDISEKIEKSIQEGYTPPSLMEEYDRIGKRWIEIVREKHSILEPILLERDKILDKL